MPREGQHRILKFPSWPLHVRRVRRSEGTLTISVRPINGVRRNRGRLECSAVPHRWVEVGSWVVENVCKVLRNGWDL